AEYRKAGADQRKELLVEDEEGFELDLLILLRGQQTARLHGENVIARLRKARAQLLSGRGRLDLLLHAPTLIGQPDDELGHRKVWNAVSRCSNARSCKTQSILDVEQADSLAWECFTANGPRPRRSSRSRRRTSRRSS